jgi:O-methyltransferase involved in polyketide biosynthesis
MTTDCAHISVTAKVAAYYRKFTDIPFAQEISAQIGADVAFEQILRSYNLEREKLTFYAPMFEARYKSITGFIRRSGTSQVLELASGYSLRGLDLSRSDAVRYVETDLPEVIAAKRSLLDVIRQRHAIETDSRHVMAAADALNFEEIRSSVEHFDRNQALTILCEGLIMYLSKEQTETLAQNIRRLLGEFSGGFWITPDFTFRVEARDLPAERIRMREAITGVTHRQVDASSFEDARELSAFLSHSRFNVQVRNQMDEVAQLSSMGILGLPPSIVDRLRGFLRLWVMTPTRSCGA